MALESRLMDIQRDFINSEGTKFEEKIHRSSLYTIWEHFNRINIFINRSRAYKDLEDSVYFPNLDLWRYGTDSLLNKIEILKNRKDNLFYGN